MVLANAYDARCMHPSKLPLMVMRRTQPRHSTLLPATIGSMVRAHIIFSAQCMAGRCRSPSVLPGALLHALRNAPEYEFALRDINALPEAQLSKSASGSIARREGRRLQFEGPTCKVPTQPRVRVLSELPLQRQRRLEVAHTLRYGSCWWLIRTARTFATLDMR